MLINSFILRFCFAFSVNRLAIHCTTSNNLQTSDYNRISIIIIFFEIFNQSEIKSSLVDDTIYVMLSIFSINISYLHIVYQYIIVKTYLNIGIIVDKCMNKMFKIIKIIDKMCAKQNVLFQSKALSPYHNVIHKKCQRILVISVGHFSQEKR